MELLNVSIDSLNILLNSNVVSDEHFDELLSSCTALTKTGTVNDKYATSDVDDTTLRNLNGAIVYGNILGLFVEAARHKYDTEHFINFLQSSKIFGGPRAEKLAIAYGEQRERWISQLTSIGNNFPCIVDVKWELDYCIRNNTNDSIGSCVYHIRLITKKHGILEHVQFTCTRHQLQELICKLRDAARHMEKLSHI